MAMRLPRAAARLARLRIAIVASVLLSPIAPGFALAAKPAAATTSPAARREAIAAIPFDKLEASVRRKVSAVVSNPSLYRRLPVQVTDCDPDLYLFLVKHPEVVVNLWQTMGISKVTLDRQANGDFKAADGAGTTGTVKFCYQDHDTQVIYAEGAYEGPIIERPLTARCVLVLKSGYIKETNGRYYVTSRLDTFIAIDNAGVELLAKTLQPLLSRSADYNFVETAGFLGNISKTAERNGQGMARYTEKLTAIEPEVREEFASLSLAVAEKRSAQAAKTATASRAVRASSARPVGKK